QWRTWVRLALIEALTPAFGPDRIEAGGRGAMPGPARALTPAFGPDRIEAMRHIALLALLAVRSLRPSGRTALKQAHHLERAVAGGFPLTPAFGPDRIEAGAGCRATSARRWTAHSGLRAGPH